MGVKPNPRELMNAQAKLMLARCHNRPQRYTPATVAARTAMVLCDHRMTATKLVHHRTRFRCDLCRCTFVLSTAMEW